MKLLNCLKCNDVIAMISHERECMCGNSKGKLEGDNVEFIGKARIFHINWSDYLTAEAGVTYAWILFNQ